MTPLIVVILAVAWVVVLVPPLLRSRTDDRPSTSVGSFRQQLATLSRTGPERRVVRYDGRGHGVVGARRPGAYPGRLTAVPRYDGGYDDVRTASGAARPPRAMAGRPARPMPMGYSMRSPAMRSGRADVRRRRLNVLVALLALASVTAIGGFAFGVSGLVVVNLVVDAVLVFYVYLLVQLRRAEEERAMRYSWSKAA